MGAAAYRRTTRLEKEYALTKPLRPSKPKIGQAAGTDTEDHPPEELLISALLESGTFEPEPLGVNVEMLERWELLWNFACEYQDHAGTAPPLALVTKKFPDFQLVPNINERWAAHLVLKAYTSRTLRDRLSTAIEAVREDDHETAFQAIEAIERPRQARKIVVSGFDSLLEQDEDIDPLFPAPYTALGRAAGGMRNGEFWMLAARPSHGKTYTACVWVAKALQAGLTVRYASCEMRAKRIDMRIARVLTKGNRKQLAVLAGTDLVARKKVLDELRESVPGTWHTVDPSHSRMNNAFVREQMHEADLVVVDHVGLMRTNRGHRAIDDWRALAEISNTLREDNLATNTPVLALSQISRKGDAPAPGKAPSGADLSGSDALLQDVDVLVTMRRVSKHVMINSAEKVREADTPLWWNRYDPAAVNFEELTRDKANAVIDKDDEFEEK